MFMLFPAPGSWFWTPVTVPSRAVTAHGFETQKVIHAEQLLSQRPVDSTTGETHLDQWEDVRNADFLTMTYPLVNIQKNYRKSTML